MEKLKSFFVSLLLFIGFSAVGITVGYFIGTAYADLKGEGKFSNWRKLDGDLKFEQIAAATSQTVWANTFDGTLFSWDTNCAREPNCNQWVQANEVPDDIQKYGGQSMERGSVCPPTNLKYYSDPPGNTVECVRAITYGMDIMPGITSYYALSDEGKIWSWKFSYSMMDKLLYGVLCSCPGLFLGILAFIIFKISRRKNDADAASENNNEKLSNI